MSCSPKPDAAPLGTHLTRMEKQIVKSTVPPDGGARAWIILIASFLCNGLIFGVINTYSVIYVELHRRLQEAEVSDAASKAALVGSLSIGMTFFLSPIAGILTDKIGIRLTTFLGGALASGGMLLSSLNTNSRVEVLYLTYGVLFGSGASLSYTPSLAILGHYFKKYLGIANGIVTAGSSVFTIVMLFALDALMKAVGLEACLQVLAALLSVIMLCGFLFQPLAGMSELKDVKPPGYKRSFTQHLKTLINIDIWKKKKYVIWALVVPSALFGYFVPYVLMVEFCKLKFPDSDGKLLIMCIGIASGVGRLIFGKVGDMNGVNRILLQQVSFFTIGVMTMLLPITPNFYLLIVITLCMGLFDGCFIAVLGPIAFELCGQKGATQAIGFLLGFCSIPLTVGAPTAGKIFDLTGSYDIPFFLAGVPPILGALILFMIRCVDDAEDNKVSLAKVESGSNGTPYENGGLLIPAIIDLPKAEDNEKSHHITPYTNGNVKRHIDATSEDENESLIDDVTKIKILKTNQ